MKKQCKTQMLLFGICAFLSTSFAFGQNEQKGFSFQGYARDFSGAAYSSTNITTQFSIYPEGESIEYSEEHPLTTDSYGVFFAEVGSITPVDFAAINFSSKKYFMKVEVKVSGGDYVTISETELLAVPYAKASEISVRSQTSSSADNGVPPGTILPFGGPVGNIPTGYLPCNGSIVTEADYPDLYDAIGDSWGGDGGTNFNLPDFQGRFMRGFDNAAGNDPDAASRFALQAGGNTGDAVGSYQGDELMSHNHIMGQSMETNAINGGGGQFYNQLHPASVQNASTSLVGGSETRPINASVLFMIKY
ncbi:MAG: tail fiber protein [Cyclobacteriaceae bacterium]